jgi:uncharacterized membrane protein YdjX (TVP38/TMEM64 family)
MSARWRLAALAAVLVSLFAAIALSGSLSPARVRDWVDGFGVAAPLVFVALSSMLTVLLFPGPLLAGASGLLFGTALGTPLSIVSATLGAVLAFGVGRWWGHDAVEELAGPRVRAVRAWIGRQGFLAVLYARIAPAVPYSLVNYAAGLSPVRLGAFTAATAIGCAPRAFAYTALGGSLDHLGRPEALAAYAVLLVMGIAGLGLARRRRGQGCAVEAGARRATP